MEFRRWTQAISLGVFLIVLILAINRLLIVSSVDFFLRLDPSVVTISALSGRFFLLAFLPAIVVVVLTLFLGRFFCGHICPMGTTLDVSDAIFSPRFKDWKPARFLRPTKYLILTFLLLAALVGVSFTYWLSPISLITRFYGLVIMPVIAFLVGEGYAALSPLWERLDINAILFFEIDAFHYATQFFVLFMFIALFALARLTPRFWCRYLCPAGAIFALFSRKPLIRRQVNSNCTDCGKCVRVCAMDAIHPDDPFVTTFSECVVCLSCEKACDDDAISFGLTKPGAERAVNTDLPTRRQFVTTGVAGAGTAIVGLTGLNATFLKTAEGRVLPETLLRPPASLPENAFLDRCVRCAECVVVCPTNTLQPIWFEAGLLSAFSPTLKIRRGYCDPDCHQCAEVCPTGAIRQVPKVDRLFAKTGTAVINRQKCLAWEYNEKCMVCDETCPFSAIEFTSEPGLDVTVPKVIENRCSGCGYCEYHCPVQNQPAIVVSPMNAIRIAEGSFEEVAIGKGLDISRNNEKKAGYPTDDLTEGGAAPGFDLDDSSGLPPGFSEEE